MALTKSVSPSKVPITVRRSGSLPSPPDRPALSMPIDEHFEGSLTEKEAYHGTGEESIQRRPMYVHLLHDGLDWLLTGAT